MIVVPVESEETHMRCARSLLLSVVFASALTASFAVAGDDPLAPGLRRAMNDAAAPARSADGTFAVWVFFQDKHLEGAALDAALQQVRDELAPRARARRAKVAANKSGRLVDVTDLPLHRPYVKAVAALGASLRRESRWLNAASFDAAPDQIRAAADLPFVRRVELVRRSKSPEIRAEKAAAAEPLDYGDSLPELEQINVPAVHEEGWNGQGVLIGMLDSGFSTVHEALSDVNVIAAWDFVNEDGVVDNEAGDPLTAKNHGTMTLSTVGANLPGKLLGPAYGASYILAKTEDVGDEQPVEEDNWVAGIEWLDTYGIDIASSSLTYYDWYEFEDLDGDTAPCTIAADLAAAKGIVVVVSAGNERANSWGHIGAPADGDSVITVGAVDLNGTVAAFSSPGPTADGRIKPDVSARGQGNRVASPVDPAAYLSVSGTSFSCPLTSGVAALVLSRTPQLTPMQVREAMRMTASQPEAPDNDLGWGVLDALAAVRYFGASMVHTPLAGTEDTVGPYAPAVEITDREALDPVGLLLHWRLAGGPWQQTTLTSAGGDVYTAEIPGQPAGSDVEYSFEAADVLGIVSTLPVDAPATVFTFHVGPDLTAPDLTHVPMVDQPVLIWPPVLTAHVVDNLEMGTVEVAWDLNGAAQAGFPLVEGPTGVWTGAFNLDASLVATGDVVTYTITAVDASLGANASASGPHSFQLIDHLGVVLVVDDSADKAAGDVKRDASKRLLPSETVAVAASAPVMTRWLRGAGYIVYEKAWPDFTELDLAGVDVLAVASGGNTAPVADTAQRGDVRRWAEQGGRLFLEGGEVGADALTDPGYADFADTTLHAAAWLGDGAGALNLAAGAELHPLAVTPNVLPATLALNYTGYGDQDALWPEPTATAVYETSAYPGAAGLLAYDDTASPLGGQTVALACNLAALADTVAARHLVENVLAWLTADEGVADGSLSGIVTTLTGDVVEPASAEVSLQTGESTTTGVDGSWTIGGLTAGLYAVTASADGFISETASVDLTAGQHATADFNLRQAIVNDLVWNGPTEIPDGDVLGMSATVDVGGYGSVAAVTVSIDLTHPWIGDLVVELVSPAGTTVRLHDRSGGSDDDIAGTWDATLSVDGPGALADFAGEDALGLWTLAVSDRLAGDVGVLDSWTLHLTTPAPPVGVGDLPPLRTALAAAAPNPFNPRTEIRFSLATAAAPELVVFDLMGRRVRTLLADVVMPAGRHGVAWLGRDDSGRDAASGVYFIRMRADGAVDHLKVTLAR